MQMKVQMLVTTFKVILQQASSDVSNVDSTTVGTYSVVYNVSDSSGNAANQVTRIVEVVDSQDPVTFFCRRSDDHA